MGEPIPVMVKRFRCPHCPRSRSSKSRMVEHIGRCWRNPATRGCLTCRHFSPAEAGDWYEPHHPESCDRGVDLSGREACGTCAGEGWVLADAAADLGTKTCPDCGGNGAAVRPGPIAGCDKWEPSDPPQDPMVAQIGAGEEF